MSRASAACWCESFFRIFLRGLLAALVLPSVTLFFASATDAAVAACREWVWSVVVEVEVCFLLRPLFVEVLDMAVRIRLVTCCFNAEFLRRAIFVHMDKKMVRLRQLPYQSHHLTYTSCILHSSPSPPYTSKEKINRGICFSFNGQRAY